MERADFTRKKIMIALCNIAIRPQPDPFPPVACTSLFNVLREAGYSPHFYDIDGLRPSWSEITDFFKENSFDIVGISAVVSTGYKFTKELSQIIKKVSPGTEIILGGNLAAAYNVMLRKCSIDICVIGEGEKVLLNLVRHFEKHGCFSSQNQELSQIKGISFLDSTGEVKFTGFEEQLKEDEIEGPDYDVLAQFTHINQYILDPLTRFDFALDKRTHELHRKGKKMATIFTSKGCVNRCSFCHRWIKGYRIIPVKKVVDTMKHLRDKYNVGFFCISDECFGENKEWLEEFIRMVKPLDILFQVGGARVSLVKKDPGVIKKLKEAGLTALHFGMESGCDKILKIMEKNADREDNLKAVLVCAEAGVFTTIQLVIGMPGENEATIKETIDFLNKASLYLRHFPSLSINYLQILPGTPCYDYLRYQGLIGKSIEEEERYLLRVSDVDAAEFKQYINVSEEPLSRVRLWQFKIKVSVLIGWLKKHKWKTQLIKLNEYFNTGAGGSSLTRKIKTSLLSNVTMYRMIDVIGNFFWEIMVLKNRFHLYGSKKAFLMAFNLIKEEERINFRMEPVSLRKFVDNYDAKQD